MKIYVPIALLLLVACSPATVVEHNCAPQNIIYEIELNRLLCHSPKSDSAVGIYCTKGTYTSELEGVKSCVDGKNVRHVIRPIILSNDEAFLKKQECNKLLPQINKILKDNDETLGTFSILDRVFYSVSMNSCLYNYTEFKKNGSESWMLRDAFTNEQLNYGVDIDPPKYRDKFREELTKYE